MPDDQRATGAPAAPPATPPASRGMSTGLAIIVAALLLSMAIVAAGWMVAHPDAATRCATSGGNWQVELSVCWYPQTSQPALDPSFKPDPNNIAPAPSITNAPTGAPARQPKGPAGASTAPAA